MKTIDETWVYIELLDTPIIPSLYRIAMKLRIDAGRLIRHLTESESSIHFRKDNELFVSNNEGDLWQYFDNDEEMNVWLQNIRTLYPVVEINGKSYVQFKILDKV